MRSLLIRIFLSFWLIIGVTIGFSAIGGYWYAERIRQSFENFESGDTMLHASAALNESGRQGLETWLKDFSRVSQLTLYVLDESGRDILQRRLPPNVAFVFERHRRHLRRDNAGHGHRDPANLRRSRPLSQLVGPNGERFTFVLSRASRAAFAPGRLPAGTLPMLLALIVSAAVSYLLARTMTRPVRKLRDAAQSLSDGDLDVQVADSVGKRRDELGLLARDFDTMARKLQKAARQQTELSRNISHELRSPLARMRVALELARRNAGASPEFDRIDAEAERLDKLIGQILSYTRFESASSDTMQTVDLAELIRDVVEDVNYECKSAGVEAVSVASEIRVNPEFRGYPEALRSAVENILRNAVRHSPPDSVVNISLEQVDTDRIIVRVVDHGDGVASRDLPQLFDAFFRTGQSTGDPADRGSGLGLAIAARAVRMNGGEVAATNHESGGLAITISLPVHGAG